MISYLITTLDFYLQDVGRILGAVWRTARYFERRTPELGDGVLKYKPSHLLYTFQHPLGDVLQAFPTQCSIFVQRRRESPNLQITKSWTSDMPTTTMLDMQSQVWRKPVCNNVQIMKESKSATTKPGVNLLTHLGVRHHHKVICMTC